MSHAVLFRDPNAGLVVREFKNAADARRAERSRVFPGIPNAHGTAVSCAWGNDRRPAVPLPVAAQLLGIKRKTLERRCRAGALPFIDNGTALKARRAIPRQVIDLIHAHGLRGVARMVEAGLI